MPPPRKCPAADRASPRRRSMERPMDEKTPTGPPSHQAAAPPDLQVQTDHPVPKDPPALPAHPEWVEIVVPWGQKAPKVVQGKMALPVPRDPKDLAANPALQEHPVCPVYLVK